MADLLNAASPREIVFGANMTTLTFAVSRAIGRELTPGDEILITKLDHDANRAPWLALAEKGVIVKEVDFDPADCTLRLDDLQRKLSPRTKVVAVGFASNAVGTINPIAEIARMVHSAGAWLWVDAVHYVPHGPVDVQALGCDFLVCSPYKFFGPHSGILWGRLELLERLPAYKVRPAGNASPDKFETGTQNHEAQAGVLAAVEYLAELGSACGDAFAGQFPGFHRPAPRAEAGHGRNQGLRARAVHALRRGPARDPRPDLLRHLRSSSLRPRARRPRRSAWPASTRTRSPSTSPAAASTSGPGTSTRWPSPSAWGSRRRAAWSAPGLAHYNTREEVDYCLECLREIA